MYAQLDRRAQRARRRHGFALGELLAVIVIILILLSIFVPFVRKTWETDRRLRCQENLRALGLALTRYATANSGAYPRVVHDARNFPSGYFAFSGPFALNPFSGDGRVSANDVTASLWLLVREGYAKPDLFICPSTRDYADTMLDESLKPIAPSGRSNFRQAANLSYSYACPFSSAPGYRFDANLMPRDVAILADKNPGRWAGSDVTAVSADAPPLEQARANSWNHDRAGQSVLFADMHVDFVRTPFAGFGASAGVAGDNIYTAMSETALPEQPQPTVTMRGVVGPQYSPAWKADTYLAPTADQDRGR